MVENIQWYKETNRDKDIDDMEDGDKKNIGTENQWKPMKRKKRRKTRGSPEKRNETEREKRKDEGIDEMEFIRGVFFVPHTENSELAKRIRERLKFFEELSNIRVKIVERTGEKIENILHNSNPWESVNCNREDCMFCGCGDEKMTGKCKKRNVVYETECLICKGELGEADGFEINDKWAEPNERNGMEMKR